MEEATKALAYLNNSTSSFPKCQQAIDSFLKALTSPPPDIRHHLRSSAPDLETLRADAAAALSAEVDSLFFIPDATFGLNCVIKSFAIKELPVFFDNRSHNAVIRSAKATGQNTKCIELYTANEELNTSVLAAIGKSGGLLCLTLMSNVNGTVYDVIRVAEIARLANPSLKVLVDASQAAGMLDLRGAIACADFLVFPAHKYLHSIPGAGILIAKERLEPLIHGGTGIDAYQTSAGRNFVEVGTANYPAIAAMVASLVSLQADLPKVRESLLSLTTRLWNGLERISGLKLVGIPPGDRHIGVVAIRFEHGLTPYEAMRYLSKQRVVVRAGHHCSPEHHSQIGLRSDGTLRLSPSRFSTTEEIDQSILAISEYITLAS